MIVQHCNATQLGLLFGSPRTQQSNKTQTLVDCYATRGADDKGRFGTERKLTYRQDDGYDFHRNGYAIVDGDRSDGTQRILV